MHTYAGYVDTHTNYALKAATHSSERIQRLPAATAAHSAPILSNTKKYSATAAEHDAQQQYSATAVLSSSRSCSSYIQ